METKEYGFYVLIVRTMAVMVLNLMAFIWLLQKVILYMRITCVTLLQISKLKHDFYDTNKNSIIDFKKRLIKMK